MPGQTELRQRGTCIWRHAVVPLHTLFLLADRRAEVRACGTAPHVQEDLGQRVSYAAAMLLLRGRVAEAQENRARAAQAYSAALALDPFCYEAFQACPGAAPAAAAWREGACRP